jgi:hypothetical protein
LTAVLPNLERDNEVYKNKKITDI